MKGYSSPESALSIQHSSAQAWLLEFEEPGGCLDSRIPQSQTQKSATSTLYSAYEVIRVEGLRSLEAGSIEGFLSPRLSSQSLALCTQPMSL